MLVRRYESARNDVRYEYGRPLRFVARLPNDPRSSEPEVWRENADRAAEAQVKGQ